MQQTELTDFKPATIRCDVPDVELVGMVRVNNCWCVNSRIDLSIPGTDVWYLVTILSIEKDKPVRIITNKESFYKCTKITSAWGQEDTIYGATNGEEIPKYIIDVALKAIATFDQGASS
jgi:hypothetical protein